MTKPPLTFLLITSLLALGACGQKGPLYLPGNPSEIRSEVSTTNSSTVPDEEEEDDTGKPSSPPR